MSARRVLEMQRQRLLNFQKQLDAKAKQLEKAKADFKKHRVNNDVHLQSSDEAEKLRFIESERKNLEELAIKDMEEMDKRETECSLKEKHLAQSQARLEQETETMKALRRRYESEFKKFGEVNHLPEYNE